MSTRSRANPWFRPVVPIAKAIVERLESEVRFEYAIRPIRIGPDDKYIDNDDAYEEACRKRVRQLILCRLSTKLVFTARLFDAKFDEQCREICPELAPLDPVTTGELRKTMEKFRA